MQDFHLNKISFTVWYKYFHLVKDLNTSFTTADM